MLRPNRGDPAISTQAAKTRIGYTLAPPAPFSPAAIRSMSVDALLRSPLRVVNIGLASFASDLAAHGVAVVQVDWRPPAGGKPELLSALDVLARHAESID